MIGKIMRECRNYFTDGGSAVTGKFNIVGGTISLPDLLPGQYFKIDGSVLNDGVHLDTDFLQDETFTGTVYLLRVPPDFVDLSERIDAWCAISGAPTPFSSESFGGYSYTKATGKNGAQLTWQQAFADELRQWRKL